MHGDVDGVGKEATSMKAGTHVLGYRVAVLDLSGDMLHFIDPDPAVSILVALADAGVRFLVIDMEDLGSFDSAGVAFIGILKQTWVGHGGRISGVIPKKIRSFFRLGRISAHFQCFESVAEAIASFLNDEDSAGVDGEPQLPGTSRRAI